MEKIILAFLFGTIFGLILATLTIYLLVKDY